MQSQEMDSMIPVGPFQFRFFYNSKNEKIFLLMLQFSFSEMLTMQNISFPCCIIEFLIFANLHKTF